MFTEVGIWQIVVRFNSLRKMWFCFLDINIIHPDLNRSYRKSALIKELWICTIFLNIVS